MQWHARIDTTSPEQQTIVELTGEIRDGWHVYALEQRPGGPTRLKIDIDDDSVAKLSGVPTGSKAEKQLDTRFGLETQFYTHAFTLRLPVQLNGPAVEGAPPLTLKVRFQSCSEDTCLPPTVVQIPVQGAPRA